jgi:hypothetical protein
MVATVIPMIKKSLRILSYNEERLILLYGKKVVKRNKSGNRIITGTTPRVTTQDTPNGKIEPLNRTVLNDGLSGILTTGGGETA